ncbi:RDD family protein [Alkalicoccus daliensis]|uniref:Uncharacterized membrane protein YckC, RDD family n=1 Tax=Alkalicoccus daliensis TaxID=745820 RepID=A0A1H0ERQ7_9BACI|nr:RDD family protein [Alkalicoccus daliensis]SDN85068.1 Uncharacterized membrane protein YckC, RDD family [Alkalicoccus daliensis]
MTNPGGFWIRLLGMILDALLISGVIGLSIFLFNLDTSAQTVQTGESVLSILYFVLVPILWHGYTVGKRIAGVRIVKKDNTEVSFFTMVLRYILGGLVYGLTFGIALIVSAIMVAARKDKRAIHDFIAGTYVTRDRPEEKGTAARA